MKRKSSLNEWQHGYEDHGILKGDLCTVELQRLNSYYFLSVRQKNS